MKQEDLVMFNGQLFSSSALSLLLKEVVPTVCVVVKEKLDAGYPASAVEEAALTCVNAITKAITVKSLDFNKVAISITASNVQTEEGRAGPKIST